MTINRVLGPTSQVQIKDVLDRTKDEVFYNMNCVQVGRIISYDPTKNTASIQIGMKRQLPNNEVVTYPPLQDCPVFFLTGGTSSISMPILPGDTCLILFNDRDIDTWWATGENNVPPTPRAHSLSDGICLVGIRNQSNKKSLPLQKLAIDGGLNRLLIKNDLGNLRLILDGLLTTLSGGLTPFLQTSLIPVLQGLTVQITPTTTAPLTPASIAALGALTTTLTTITGQLTATAAQLALLLDEGV
jgi:hypothetical protein